MSSLFTNLLFLHGHIADVELARRLADAQKPSRPTGKRKRISKALPASLKSPQPTTLAHGGCA